MPQLDDVAAAGYEAVLRAALPGWAILAGGDGVTALRGAEEVTAPTPDSLLRKVAGLPLPPRPGPVRPLAAALRTRGVRCAGARALGDRVAARRGRRRGARGGLPRSTPTATSGPTATSRPGRP
jgi:hypothetical protein